MKGGFFVCVVKTIGLFCNFSALLEFYNDEPWNQASVKSNQTAYHHKNNSISFFLKIKLFKKNFFKKSKTKAEQAERLCIVFIF